MGVEAVARRVVKCPDDERVFKEGEDEGVLDVVEVVSLCDIGGGGGVVF